MYFPYFGQQEKYVIFTFLQAIFSQLVFWVKTVSLIYLLKYFNDLFQLISIMPGSSTERTSPLSKKINTEKIIRNKEIIITLRTNPPW